MAAAVADTGAAVSGAEAVDAACALDLFFDPGGRPLRAFPSVVPPLDGSAGEAAGASSLEAEGAGAAADCAGGASGSASGALCASSTFAASGGFTFVSFEALYAAIRSRNPMFHLILSTR